MQPKKQENRGGRRAGSGRKTLDVGEFSKDRLSKIVKRRMTLTGKSPEEVLVDIIYDGDSKINNKLEGLKIYYKVLGVGEKTEVNINNHPGPVIGLPEIQQPTIPIAPTPNLEEMN